MVRNVGPQPFPPVGGGGFTLGPSQNAFTGADRAAAESARDAYATANPSWLASYNNDTTLNIRLEYTDGTDSVALYQVRNNAGDEWLDNSSSVGVQGPPGMGEIDQTIPAGTILQAVDDNGTITAGQSSIVEMGGMLRSTAPLQLPGGGALQFDNNDIASGGTVSGGASGVRIRNLTDDTIGYLVNSPFTTAGGTGKPFYDKFTAEISAPSLSDRSDTRNAAFDFINPLPGIVTEYTVARPAGSATLTDCNFIIWLDGYNTGTPLFDFKESNPGGAGFTLQAGLNTVVPPVPIGFPANINPAATDQIRLYSHVVDANNNLIQLEGQEVQFPPSPDPRSESTWIPYLERKVHFSEKIEIRDTTDHDTNYVGLYGSLADLQSAYPTPEDGLYASVTDSGGEPDERYESSGGSWSSIGSVSGEVFVAGNKSKGITLGSGLTYSDDNGNAKITATGSGVVVVDFDVSQNQSITLNETFNNKIANLIQSQSTLVLATITISSTATYNVGDVLRIQADETYLYHFYSVFYTDDNGQQRVVYPAKNVTLIKTSKGWNVEEGGRFNRVAIRPGADSGTPIAGDDTSIENVQVISVIQSQAAEILTDSNGNSALQFDFSKLDGTTVIDDSSPEPDKTYSSEKVEELAPYRVYKSVSEIESDFGPITITPLDGSNDEQIRANNTVNVLDAIGNEAEAYLVIGNDTSIAPIPYCELMFISHNTQRTSVRCVSKNSSDSWVFSAAVSDAGSDTSSRWYQVQRVGTDIEMTGADIKDVADISIDNTATTSIYSKNHAQQSINYFNDGDLSIGAVSNVDIGINGIVKQSFNVSGLDMKGTKVRNLTNGTDDQDAVSKLQSENFVSDQFQSANNAVTESSAFEVDIRDSSRDDGYGNSSGTINYLGVQNNQVLNPDTSYGKIFFIHEKVNSTAGVIMIHEDLLSSVVTNTTESVPFKAVGARCALGRSQQTASVIVNDADAIWNCQGAAIQNIDDANVIPPANNYYDKSGNKGAAEKLSSAASALYSSGAFSAFGDPELVRANVKNIDDQSVEIIPTLSSPWFVTKCSGGGGTFNVKKIFQLFFVEYDETFYSTDNYAIAFGLKVQDNRERVEELERQSNESTQVEQQPDVNGVSESLFLPSVINNRIEIDSGETKTLNVGYQFSQVNLVAYDVVIKSMVTDTNDANYGRNFEIRGAIVKSNGSISFIKSQAIGESLNISIAVAEVDDHIEVTLSNAPCKLSINTKAVVKR